MKERQLSPVEEQQFADLRWAERAPEVRQHAGKLVIVYRQRVITVGTDEEALLQQAAAQENCSEEDLTIIAVPPTDLQEIPH